MADLNELSQFEKDLKNLIEIRNGLKPEYTYTPPPISPRTKQRFEEREYKRLYAGAKMGMFMGIPEHGQPYKTEIVSHMCVPEHGNPYDWDGQTLMCVPEHGKPFKSFSTATRMAVYEHGQPYKTPRRVKSTADMVIRTAKEEHDYMKSTSFDYCPNIMGKKCGRPGCS